MELLQATFIQGAMLIILVTFFRGYDFSEATILQRATYVYSGLQSTYGRYRSKIMEYTNHCMCKFNSRDRYFLVFYEVIKKMVIQS